MSWYRFAGQALPYDVTTRRGMRFWTFAPGAIEVRGPVLLLRDHDQSLRRGRAVLENVDLGLSLSAWTRTFVRVGQGLSIGITVLARDEDRVLHAVADEVSIVDRPAFPSCKISSVLEEDGPWPRTPALT